jgi:hypothetical protein
MTDGRLSHIKLGQEDMDRIIAIDAYQRDPAKAKKLAYIAQEVFRSGIDPTPAHADYYLDYLNPLSIFTNPRGRMR